MSRFIEHSMNLDTVKHSQDDLYFRTEGVLISVRICLSSGHYKENKQQLRLA